MAGYLTSYAGLFLPPVADAPAVTSIEIPLVQRDYAQGRTGRRETEIRTRFLDVLYGAVAGGETVGLDFIYGDVDGGLLRPLDGQQRLTTLFLLHWYLGYRAGELRDGQAWTNFSYATRPSARLFCQRLVASPPPAEVSDPTGWIVDQSWYLYVWRHDPTIQAMLVMIKAIRDRFANCDVRAAWDRLTSADDPAVSFQLLPIDEMGSGEELYIKMNSRGKPLTAFENFKARFESAISWAGKKSVDFDHRVDGVWSDLLWRFHGSDDLIDDRFLRYFTFITDVCEWRLGQVPRGRFEGRALRLFGTEGADAEASLDFLFHAFETWVGRDITDEFRSLFATGRVSVGHSDLPLLLFGTDLNANLFEACCRNYDSDKGRFSYGRTLLLLAVLLDRAEPSDEFPQHARVLRNLIEASESEIRPHRLPALVADVEHVVAGGSVEGIRGFNRAQADDERAKKAFLLENPALRPALMRLEDHPVLHGSLQAFELDAGSFQHRSETFASVMRPGSDWKSLTGALLAAGDYSRRRNDRDLQFGSPTNAEPWRTLLTGTTRDNLKGTASALGIVLDSVAGGPDTGTALAQLREGFLRECGRERYFDWRYYLVRYEAMREGPSGIYASVGGRMGYGICMLNKTQMNGRYRDPYLTALVRDATASEAVVDGTEGPFFIGGFVGDERWLYLRKSRTGLRCGPGGWVLMPPTSNDLREPFRDVCVTFGIDERLQLSVPQQTREGSRVDTEDRIEAGSRLLQALILAGG